MKWFRFYSGAVNDPKVQRLPPELFKVWVNLLCLASENDGKLPDAPDIAYTLRMSEQKVADKLKYLKECGLLDETETGTEPHNWGGRQFKTDVSTERVKRFRKRHETVSETPPDTEQSRTESETEQKIDTAPSRGEREIVLREWNSLAQEFSLPQIKTIDSDRHKRLNARIQQAGSLKAFLGAMQNIRGSPFLQGDSDSGFRADFDFILQRKSFRKLSEGSYNGTPAKCNSIAEGFGRIRQKLQQRIADEEGAGDDGSSGDVIEIIPRLQQGS